jgi:hypothetical protein
LGPACILGALAPEVALLQGLKAFPHSSRNGGSEAPPFRNLAEKAFKRAGLQASLDNAAGLFYIGLSMSATVRDQIIEQVDRLDDPQRIEVVNFARRLGAPVGTPGQSLLHFAGAIPPWDLEAMAQAIEEGCEKVDPNAW